MQTPPLRITGNPSLDWLLLIALGLFILYHLKALRLSRETARPALRHFIIGVIVGVLYYLWRGVAHGDSAVAEAFIFGFAALIFLPRKRTRYIPAKVKREVIARDLKGERYDSRKHHIDHKWAYSRGGSHTKDNLRVIDKTKNLKKGAKKPGLWEIFFD
jgi:hypothetical protein